jgi:hypothetical protein
MVAERQTVLALKAARCRPQRWRGRILASSPSKGEASGGTSRLELRQSRLRSGFCLLFFLLTLFLSSLSFPLFSHLTVRGSNLFIDSLFSFLLLVTHAQDSI